MNINDIHNQLVSHYHKARNIKTRRSIQIESIVGKTYKKKAQQTVEMSPVEDFVRNQKHIGFDSYPLQFRSLPRRLKVHFPGPAQSPPQLSEVPYTYEIVPNVQFQMPKQKPGYVGDWVLEESFFSEKKNKKKGSLSLAGKAQKFQIVDIHDRRKRFRSEIKRLAGEMKEKNLSLKEIIKNKGLKKKSHNFYNSEDFFSLAKTGDSDIERLLQVNQQLAFDVDEQQMTGLHWAAREGHPYICKLLLQKFRANVGAKDCYGRTPLHLAVLHKNSECVIRIFIEGGLLGAMNKEKKSVRMVAPDSYTKYLLEKLEEIKFVVKTKGLKRDEQRKALEESIRNALDESSLYF